MPWNTTRQIILFAELCIGFCRVMVWLTRQKIKICRVKHDHSTHWILILCVVAIRKRHLVLMPYTHSVDRGGSDEVTNRGWSDEVLLKP